MINAMKSKLSLLIITGDSPESFSPAGERVRHMALASSQFFDKVWILALGVSKNNLQKTAESRVLLHELKWARGLPYPISAVFDPVKALLFFLSGLTLATKGRLNYILASMPPVEAGASAWILAKLARKKLIVDLRDDIESALEANLTRYIPIKLIRPLFKLTRQVCSSSKIIFAATQTIANTAQEREVSTPIRYVPNGADTSLFQPQNKETQKETRIKYSLPSEKVIIVYVGSGINPYYRLDAVLHAVKALPEATKERVFFLFYVYNGIENLNKLKEELKLPNDLAELRRPIPRSSLAEVLAACDVGLVPFDNKPYLLCARSTKLYEYLSCGACIVCSGPTGGELDVLVSVHPSLGLFTQPTVERFVHAFSQVVKEADIFLSEEMKSLRHRFIKENFDRKKTMMKAMKNVLD